jgi:hypothetical protein
MLYRGVGTAGQQIGNGSLGPPPAPCNWAFYFQNLGQYVGQQVTLQVSAPGATASSVTFYLAGAYSKPEGDSRQTKGNRKK